MPELLAPAKDYAVAVAAINHGADAVYMAADRFGARAAAGNSLADLERAAVYAHRYRAKLYLTLNTILHEHELEAAQQLATAAYHAGCDALIVQDMALLEMALPPIALHASTQCHIATPSKAMLLHSAGFRRAVLARELSPMQIAHIAQAAPALELEAFVHGALCVSYSGQCYLSCHLTGRSANRGECAQPCRSAYNLVDGSGSLLARNKHLLSLRDLNLTNHLQALAQCSVRSFKIEGRLKDIGYVKNLVAHYRRAMDATFAGQKKPSSGSVVLRFEPNPDKTFSRGYTTYFCAAPQPSMASLDTPKSLGENMGNITHVEGRCLTLASPDGATFRTGDGVCFLGKNGELHGANIVRVEGNRIWLGNADGANVGAALHRNLDVAFQRQLAADNSAERRITVRLQFVATPSGITLTATDEDGVSATFSAAQSGAEAENADLAMATIKVQLGKSGSSIFSIAELNASCDKPRFYRAAALNEWRRTALQMLEAERLKQQRSPTPTPPTADISTPPTSDSPSLDYRANVLNSLAKQHYARQGASRIAPAYELHPPRVAELMRSRYCILRELGCCKKTCSHPLREPLFLENNGRKLRLKFDCARCEMVVESVPKS
jgi:putative protease